MAKTPKSAALLRQIRERHEAGEGPHPLARWAQGRADSLGPCSHWWKHTVYGSDDPKRNGTFCVLCNEKL